MIRVIVKGRLPSLRASLLGAALVASLACDYRSLSVVGNGPAGGTDLGVACPLGTDDAGPTSISIDTQSTACSSHLCLKPAEEKTTDTAAFCTQTCQQDSDCLGGEARDPQDTTDQRCQTGFTCRAIVPNLASLSTVACQKLCVCQDFLVSAAVVTPPAGCP